MAETKRCELCNGEMVKISSEIIGDTDYAIWKCKKCNHEVATSGD